MSWTSPPRPASLIASLSLLLLLGAGAWHALAFLGPSLADSDLSRWHEGQWGREAERRLSKDSPWAQALQRGARRLGYQAWGDLGPEVRRGCPGWLFYAEEFVPPDWTALEARLNAASRLRAHLAQRGIALVLLPVPDKARIQSQELCGLTRHPGLEGRLARIITGLEQRGLTALDLRQSWPTATPQAPLYFHADTHWNASASQLAALALGQRLTQQHPGRFGPGLAVIRQPGSEAVPGDLLKLTRMDHARIGLAAEQMPRYAFPALPSSAPAGLLDDTPAAPLMLIGSSYSRNAHFADFLRAALGREIGTLTRDGAGFHGAMADWLANPAFRDAPPAVVVWEFPERAVSKPMEPAEQHWIASLAQP